MFLYNNGFQAKVTASEERSAHAKDRIVTKTFLSNLNGNN